MCCPLSFSWLDLGWHGRLKRPQQARQRQVWMKLHRQQLLLEVQDSNVFNLVHEIRQNLQQP
jgi:hypothetical protein